MAKGTLRRVENELQARVMVSLHKHGLSCFSRLSEASWKAGLLVTDTNGDEDQRPPINLQSDFPHHYSTSHHFRVTHTHTHTHIIDI